VLKTIRFYFRDLINFLKIELQKKRMKKYLIISILLLETIYVSAQKDSVLLDEVYVNSSKVPVLYSETARVLNVISRDEIMLTPVQNIQDILKYVAGIDIRQRGAEGVQADVSIRGGSFEQALILLNGIKINDPQTGHHNLNIPIDIESIDRIEILEGPASRIYGQNAFTGAINIITNTSENTGIKLSGYYGNDNLYKAGIAANLNSDYLKQHLSFSSKASDGYTENTDFDNKNIFYNAKINSNYGFFNLQAGYTEKNFGANNFYSTLFPNQYEEISSFIGSLKYIIGGNHLKFTSAYFWKRHKDYFLLRRDDPTFYQNNHLTDVYGSEYTLIYNSGLGSTSLSFEYRKEKLLSSSMGELMDNPIDVKDRDAQYLKEYLRNVFSLSFEHSVEISKFNLAAGIIANWNDDFGFGAYPGIDVSLKLNEKLKLISSLNSSFRTPSFTELLYLSPTHKGNTDLKPEEALSFEVGSKYKNNGLAAQFVLFYRKGTNIIDWVKPINDDNAKWETRNLSNINTSGVELTLNYKPIENSILQNLRFSYTYLAQDMVVSNEFDSKYVLDFLKHKFNASLQHKVYKKLSASWQLTTQDREGGFAEFATGNFINYDLFTTLDGKLVWNENKFTIYFDVNNIFDVDYFDFENIIMPGRWMKIGLKINLFQ